MSSKRRVTLTSPNSLLCPDLGAPTSAHLNDDIGALYRAAAAIEISNKYADRIANDCLSHGVRLDFLRAVLVLGFKNASAHTAYDAVEEILGAALSALCEGRHASGGIIGNGMAGSDGRDHLRELDRDEGEPLTRIANAVERCRPIEVGGA